jgi:hypothetical protein
MNIYEKWQAMMDETGAIERDTEVGFGHNKYSAVGEKAVLNMVKPLLKKYKLIVFPVDVKAKEMVDTIITAKGEATRAVTQVIVTWQIVDTESTEKMEMMSIGNGADSQDKGTGKAMTYAYKVLFQKSLMLFSGEDTDHTHSDKITDDAESKTVEAFEVDIIRSYIKKTPDASEEKLITWFNKGAKRKIKSLEEMTAIHYAKAIRLFETKEAEKEADEVSPE